MKFNGIEMTPREMAEMTFEDITEKRRLKEEGRLQADLYLSHKRKLIDKSNKQRLEKC